MIQIENQGRSESIFAHPCSREVITLTPEEILEIQTEVLDQQEEQINVKNLFSALRAVFKLIDEKAPAMSDQSRLTSAYTIISNIIDESQGSNKFTVRALKLLAEYSVSTIADESKPKAITKDDVQAFEEDYDPVSLSTQLEKNSKLHRNRFDDVFSPCEESLLSVFNESLPSNQASEAIEIPSRKASKELSSAVAANPEAIDKQVEEAKQYIRKTALEIDGKVVEIQQKLKANIEKALLCVDEVRETVKEALENAQDFSEEIKGEVAQLVNQFAEKMIDAIQNPNGPQIQMKPLNSAAIDTVDELDEKAEELEHKNEDQKTSLDEVVIDIPVSEIIASS